MYSLYDSDTFSARMLAPPSPTLRRIVSRLIQFSTQKFWGKTILTWQDGQVVMLEETRTYKPEELGEIAGGDEKLK